MAEYIECEALPQKKERGFFLDDDFNAGWNACLNSIESIPSADVRPVVRGKWVNYGDEYRPDIRCCVCGQRKPILLGNFNFNFCPNCGADMREVQSVD